MRTVPPFVPCGKTAHAQTEKMFFYPKELKKKLYLKQIFSKGLPPSADVRKLGPVIQSKVKLTQD